MLKKLQDSQSKLLRGTDNFYFILITFYFTLELVLINRVINIFFNRVTHMTFLLVISDIK